MEKITPPVVPDIVDPKTLVADAETKPVTLEPVDVTKDKMVTKVPSKDSTEVMISTKTRFSHSCLLQTNITSLYQWYISDMDIIENMWKKVLIKT